MLNRHLLKTALTTAALATALVGGLAAPSSAAVPETRIRPAQLDRGADLAYPHVVGTTIVDGDVRVPLKAGLAVLLGTAGDEYVVGTSNASGSDRYRTFRITADGARTPLLRGVPIFEQTLSQDGSQIGRASTRRGRHTTVKVWSAVDGERQSTRRFTGAASILDFDEHRMVLGSFSPQRTFWWDVDADTTKRISPHAGYIADIAANRFGVIDGDPYDGGCSRTARLSAPATTLWRSCQQAVRAFAPSGGRTVTDYILSDGPGPSAVQVHGTHGKLLARYRAPYLFGALVWESARNLTLETYGRKKGATVRCDLTDCERATKLSPAPSYRFTPREQLALRP